MDNQSKTQRIPTFTPPENNAPVFTPPKAPEKAEKILLSDEGIAPLYYKTEAWLVRPDIKGIVYNGAGLNYNFKNTYVAN